ncbi:MAG: 50S ribosomal protein L15 [Candidatus Saccharimonadales bacterium]
MKFHELKVTSNKAKHRVGRGISAGQGKTAGRGTKGQNSRTGKGRRPGFEGGQNPLMQRLPKLPGFTPFWPKTENVFTGQLNVLSGTVDNFTLADAGLVSNPHVKVKLIVKGDLSKKLKVHIQSASLTAIAAVEKAGGTFTATPQVRRIAKDVSKDK